MSEEINIQEMSIDELYELMKEDLYDGLAEEITAEVNEALSRGKTPYEVLYQWVWLPAWISLESISGMASCSFQKCSWRLKP